MDNKTIQNYIDILHKTGLVELVKENRSGSSLLKGVEKIYLDNPDLYSAIIQEIGFESKTGTIREIFFIKMVKNAGKNIYYSRIGDFEVDSRIFEIGGKSKKMKQIEKSVKEAFLVKDNILFGSKHEIPLYHFGFLY